MEWIPPKGISALVGLNGSGKSWWIKRFKTEFDLVFPAPGSERHKFYHRAMEDAFPADAVRARGAGSEAFSILLGAVSLVKNGSIVAIDEPETSLHPHAIRVLIREAARFADQHDLSIVMATHSPVVLNALTSSDYNQAAAWQIFTVRRGEVPVQITVTHDPDWLAQFSLGDLFMQGELD